MADHEVRTFTYSVRYPGMSCWGFMLLDMSVTYALLMPLLYCGFHRDRSLLSTLRRLVSRACRGSCVSVTFAHVVATTLLPAVAAQARLTPGGHVAFACCQNIACVMQADARPVISTPSSQNLGHFFFHMQWSGRAVWLSCL